MYRGEHSLGTGGTGSWERPTLAAPLLWGAWISKE
jgi:hypothetical protein